MRIALTQQRLKELLRYDPETGEFIWLAPKNRVRIGQCAGGLTRRGYVQIKIDRLRYSAHCLAWLYMTGEWPRREQISHRNGAGHDNRWVNLYDRSRNGVVKLTQSRLKELLHYDPQTGQFTWIKNHGKSIRAGTPADNRHPTHGYIRVRVDDVLYAAHRLAWFYMKGEWPRGEIDHRNGIRDDNRWKNLRDGSHGQNQQNRRRTNKNNLSGGLLGVTRPKNCIRFQAKIVVDGKERYIGSFPTPEEAHAAYLKAKRELHPGCTI